MIHRALHLSLWTGLQLHHIHAHRQPFKCQRVVKELIIRSGVKLLGLVDNGLAQQRLNLLIALAGRWRLVEIALTLHGIDRHGERREMAHIVQLYLLCLHRASHLQVVLQMELRVGHAQLVVSKLVYLRPLTPLLYGIVDKGDALGR